MPSLRQIRRSLRSVQNTRQIMRAMQLVSASKLKRAQTRLSQAHQVLEFVEGLGRRVLASPAHGGASPTNGTATIGFPHPLCEAHDGRGSLLVLFTSDTGLCGAYNTSLIHLAEAHLRRPFDFAQGAIPSEGEGKRDSARRTRLAFIGRKGYRYFTTRGYVAEEAYLDVTGRPDIARAEAIGRALMGHVLSGAVGSISLLYARVVSSVVSRPTVQPWLPIQFPIPSSQLPVQEYIFEPSRRRVLEELLPRWALATFVAVMLGAFTSEHSARMLAMKNATDNAQTLIDELTLQRNTVRQAMITKEISEIVGTAEALT